MITGGGTGKVINSGPLTKQGLPRKRAYPDKRKDGYVLTPTRAANIEALNSGPHHVSQKLIEQRKRIEELTQRVELGDNDRVISRLERKVGARAKPPKRIQNKKRAPPPPPSDEDDDEEDEEEDEEDEEDDIHSQEVDEDESEDEDEDSSDDDDEDEDEDDYIRPARRGHRRTYAPPPRSRRQSASTKRGRYAPYAPPRMPKKPKAAPRVYNYYYGAPPPPPTDVKPEAPMRPAVPSSLRRSMF